MTVQASERDWIGEIVADLPSLCTTKEAQGVLRTTNRNIYRLVAAGRLHAVRPADSGSSRLLIPRASIEQYLRRLDEAAA